jgi:NADH dehydrogenase FAD-containing subunit
VPPEAKNEIPLDIHIVDERDGYCELKICLSHDTTYTRLVHLIGCPLAFSSNEYASKIWTRFEDIPALQHPNIRWTRGSVVKVDTDKLTAQVRHAGNGEETQHAYDYLVAASGLRRAHQVAPQSLIRKQYLLETANHIQGVKDAQNGVVVIGGGAVGIEMAAELKLVQPALDVTLIHSRNKLLSSEPLPSECSDMAIEALKELGVKLILGKRVLDTAEVKEDGKVVQNVTLQDGTQLLASRVITAISRSIPTTSYLPAPCLDAEKFVKINSRLRFLDGTPNDERHFAIGDLVAWSGIKRCGGAIAMGRTAAVNIYKQILSDVYGIVPEFEEWPEVPP